jgi:Uncharacterized protein conserved in bacteria
MNRILQTVLAAAVVAAVTVPLSARAENAVNWIRHALRDELESATTCGRRQAALIGTLERTSRLSLPSIGKVLLVNIPSGVITAYEDGEAVIESRAIVGRKSTPTPEMDTYVTFVRPNPTWTVPESILARKRWRELLARDPGFFERSGFDVVLGGRKVRPGEAADHAEEVSAFIQRPGALNALGRIKIGIANSQAIYLHDTNEPDNFEDEVRLASSGCVRVERIQEIAAWLLGIDPDEMEAMIADGDIGNHVPPQRVRVIIGYWTAWPGADGRIRYYPDVYGKDGDGDTCRPGQSDAPTANGTEAIWTEYKAL